MKYGLCLILALLLTAAAWFQPCWLVSAGGETAEGTYTLSACLRGLRAAEAAADELQAKQGAPPGVTVRLCFSARPPSEEAGSVSDLLLRHTEGVTAAERCLVNGAALGCTAEGAALREALRRHIFETRPAGAVSGRYTEEVRVEPVYTRAGRDMPAEALAARVTGLVPVMYTDGEGLIVAG